MVSKVGFEPMPTNVDQTQNVKTAHVMQMVKSVENAENWITLCRTKHVHSIEADSYSSDARRVFRST